MVAPFFKNKESMYTAGIATGAEIPYVEHKSNNGTTYRVIDLDNLENCPRTGTVIFEATTRKNESRANEIPFRACQDKATGVWIGIFQGFNKHDEPVWKPIYLDRMKLFNREIKEDAQKVAVLLRSNIVEGSPNLSTSNYLKLFRVHDPEKAAAIKITTIKESVRAVTEAQGLYGKSLRDMARILGIDTEHTNETILMGAVLERAHKNPTEFLTALDNPDRERLVVFHTAHRLGIITHDALKGYFFHTTPLGNTAHHACRYFEQYPEVLTNVDNQCKQREAETKISMTPTHKKQDPKVAELEAKLAVMEKLLQEKNNVAPDGLEQELQEAISTAESLGIRPLHVYKPNRESIDKLKAKIEEKQKETA